MAGPTARFLSTGTIRKRRFVVGPIGWVSEALVLRDGRKAAAELREEMCRMCVEAIRAIPGRC